MMFMLRTSEEARDSMNDAWTIRTRKSQDDRGWRKRRGGLLGSNLGRQDEPAPCVEAEGVVMVSRSASERRARLEEVEKDEDSADGARRA